MKKIVTITQCKVCICCILLGILLGGIWLLSGYITPVYAINDDMTIRCILNGDYTGVPDGHAIYMQYPLSGLLSLLYSLSDLPWLEIVTFVFIVGSMFIILYDASNRLISFLLCVILVYPLYFTVHYTTTAAILSATAVLVIYRNKRSFLFPVLWLLSYMLRKEVGLLCIPFMVMAFLLRFVNQPQDVQKRIFRRALPSVVTAVLGFILCFVINEYCYGSDEWKDFQAFNKYRVSLYDYTDFIPSEYYKFHCEEFGMTADEHHILTTYNILLDEGLDTGKMKQLWESIATYTKQNRNVSREWIAAVKTLLSQFYYLHYPYNLLCIVGYLFAGLYIIGTRKWKYWIPLACLGLGKNLISVFLIWQGRFPERVAVSLYLLELFSLWGQVECLKNETRDKYSKVLTRFVALCAALGLTFTGYSVMKNAWEQNQTALAYQDNWEQIKKYCAEHPENLYWGYTFSVQPYAGIPYEETVSNLYMLGCWTAHSPLVEKLFKGYGAADAAELLVFHDNAHLLIDETRDLASLQAYFNHRFGGVNFEPVSQIDGESGIILIDYKLTK